MKYRIGGKHVGRCICDSHWGHAALFVVLGLSVIFAGPQFAGAADGVSLLKSKGLAAEEDRGGTVWVLPGQAKLAEAVKLVDAALGNLKAFDAQPQAQQIKQQYSEVMAEWQKKDDEFKLEQAVRAYRGFGDPGEVDDFNKRIFPAYVKFVRETLEPAQANEAHRLAERKKVIDNFGEIFIAADDLAAQIHKKYIKLKKDPDVAAAILESGDRLGPSRSFARSRKAIEDASKEAVSLDVNLKDVKFSKSDFVTDLDIPIVKGLDPKADPGKYLQARSFEKREGKWILRAEDELPKRIETADEYSDRINKLRPKTKPRLRKDIESAKRKLMTMRRLLDKEQNGLKKTVEGQGGFYAHDFTNLHKWQDKKRKEIRFEWKIRDKETTLNNAEDLLAIAMDDEYAFLEKAIEQAEVIAVRYGELAEDDDVIAALEITGDELGPSKLFASFYNRLKSKHRKAFKAQKRRR